MIGLDNGLLIALCRAVLVGLFAIVGLSIAADGGRRNDDQRKP